MIVQIRGTSGAGKSHIVRAIMAQFQDRQEVFREGRKQPIYYILGNGIRPLVVPGHYNRPCGGCDTIKTNEETFGIVMDADAQGRDVLFEGIMAQDAALSWMEPLKDRPHLIVGLTTPIEECLAGIQQRRDGRGDTRPLNPNNTVNRAKSQDRALAKLAGLGFNVERLGREEALRRIQGVLGA